jgi:glycosyltransferase involved in cell wall biosynthesis
MAIPFCKLILYNQPMFKGKTVSLVFPVKNEKENLANAINSFKKIKVFDEIIVVDNNSTDGSDKIAKKHGAIVVIEKNPGYGFALRKGIEKTSGDYIVLCEPDGTFFAPDSLRLLERIDKYDMVSGSRTNKKYIKKGANMGLFLRSGNMLLAKFMQLTYGLPSLSDCGCTFRVIKKPLAKKLLNQFTVGQSYFLSELVVLAALNNAKILEIPVSYYKRQGTSKITGSKKRALGVGLKMFKTILKYRIKPNTKR